MVEEEDHDITDDHHKYFIDIDDYLDNKGLMMIEKIKDIVGSIMGTCPNTMKYEILEVIMKGVIFEKKKLRDSFMQEILNSGQKTTYMLELEKYLNDEEN